jgi:lipoprotein-anchoring transpeptidase ErfK/SrfK
MRVWVLGIALVGGVIFGLLLTNTRDLLDGESTPTSAPAARLTRAPTPYPTEEPTPLPTATPQLAPGAAIVVGGEVRTRGDPSTVNPAAGVRQDGEALNVVGVVQGENWLVGDQTWVSATPPWASEWLQLDDGSYVFGAFVFSLAPDETSPLIDPQGEEKWIDVNLSTQTVAAMVGDRAIHMALATTGSPEFPTPKGTHIIQPDGRIVLERMTASQAGYAPGQAQYDVERVLFTQYFDRYGNALHLNYWRPAEVFGTTATSHGCVGLQLHDAQYFWLFGEPNMRVEIHD